MLKVSKLDEGDVLVFSGNAPVYLLENVNKMIEDCAKKNVKIVLDTNPNIIKNCLQHKPFLIKPSLVELEEILDEKLEINKIEDLIEHLKKHITLYQNYLIRFHAKRKFHFGIIFFLIVHIITI